MDSTKLSAGTVDLLEGSELQKQVKILEQLIYKYRNQHGREKYFKCLKMIETTMKKLRLLALKDQLSVNLNDLSTSTIEDHMYSIKYGGCLVIRSLILCQQTVQHSLGVLSLGFFTALHVTLCALLSRMWVLLKSHWFTLVQCYKTVRLVYQARIDENTIFPECLSILLKDELRYVNNLTSEQNIPDEIQKSKLSKNELRPSTSHKDIDLGEPITFENYQLVRNSDVSLAVLPNQSKALNINNEKDPDNSDSYLISKHDQKGEILDNGSMKPAKVPCAKLRHTCLPPGKMQQFIPRYRYSPGKLLCKAAYRILDTRHIRGLRTVIKHLLQSEVSHDIPRSILRFAKRRIRREIQKRKKGRRKSFLSETAPEKALYQHKTVESTPEPHSCRQSSDIDKGTVGKVCKKHVRGGNIHWEKREEEFDHIASDQAIITGDNEVMNKQCRSQKYFYQFDLHRRKQSCAIADSDSDEIDRIFEGVDQ